MANLPSVGRALNVTRPVNQPNAIHLRSTREAIDAAIAHNDFAAARAMLAMFDGGPLDPASASFVVSRFEKLRGHLPLPRFRLAVLRSFTIEPLVPVLRAAAFLAGIDLEVRVGQFNTYAQEILDPAGWIGPFQPDAVFLAVQARDVVPVLWNDFADLSESQVREQAAGVVEQYRQLIAAFRGRSSASLVVHNLQAPPVPVNGLLDAQTDAGQVATFLGMNQELARLAREFRNVYALDYDALIRRHGDTSFHDPVKWSTARMPIAAGQWVHLAREWVRFLCPLSGRVCKALAVDLDNTLWGGIVGEDGFDGIKLGDAHPGGAYRALQRAMLDLSRRGILLTICSKNNPAEALDVIDRHPGMLLRREHFAAMRINWADKAQNLREIAAELNIGPDAIAFLDDNPVERDWVRRQVPEVTVIELPGDPFEFANVLRQAPVFERLELSADDRERGRYYRQQQERTEFQAEAASLEDFYRGLHMRVAIEPVTPATLPRAAQLTQKTNQFNLTTRRYTEEQLSRMTPPQWGIYTLRAQDRFGDNGLVGVAILKFEGPVAEIDTLLLSCRVIGRTIETAFLAALARAAYDRGATKLAGWYLPTAKNAPARDVYRSHGFTLASEEGRASRWELSLPAAALKCPEWIECRVGPEENRNP
jgi:FkbH-like protein